MKLIPYKDYDSQNNLPCKLYYRTKKYIKGKIIFCDESFQIIDFKDVCEHETINKIEDYLNSIDLKLMGINKIDAFYYFQWLKLHKQY